MNREQRRSPRIPISRRGELSYKGVRFPCLLHDISARGFLICSARNPVVGQQFGLSVELTPGHRHQCKIQVRHVENGCLGAEITEVGEQEYKLFQHFVQQYSKESQLQASQYSRT